MQFCTLLGTPALARRATIQNKPKNTSARTTEKNTVS